MPWFMRESKKAKRISDASSYPSYGTLCPISRGNFWIFRFFHSLARLFSLELFLSRNKATMASSRTIPQHLDTNKTTKNIPPEDSRTKNNAAFSIESYQEALGSNQDLQIDMERRLAEIRQLKHANRKQSAKLSQQLLTLDGRRLLGGVNINSTNNCEWNKQFFVDRKGTTPRDNEDTVKRKAAEAAFQFKFSDDWTKNEVRILERICKKHNDWEVVTSQYNQHPVIDTPRTLLQCQKAYYSYSYPKFTKTEQSDLAKMVASSQEIEGTSSSIDWVKVAVQMSSQHRTRSPWEYCKEYHTAIHVDPQQPWTQQQDELLFKYAAAIGPRLLVETSDLEPLLAGVLHDCKTKSQIVSRFQNSLLNPNLVRDAWTNDEERRLAIGMKIYHDQPDKTHVYHAGLHIAERSRHSIHDKWHRSLNPAFSARPFTKEEDKQLVQVLSDNPHMGWLEVARTFFPDRHPHRIMNRWSEVATDEDIVRRSQLSLLQNKSSRGRGVVLGAASTADPTVQTDELVVQVKKRRRT